MPPRSDLLQVGGARTGLGEALIGGRLAATASDGQGVAQAGRVVVPAHVAVILGDDGKQRRQEAKIGLALFVAAGLELSGSGQRLVQPGGDPFDLGHERLAVDQPRPGKGAVCVGAAWRSIV